MIFCFVLLVSLVDAYTYLKPHRYSGSAIKLLENLDCDALISTSNINKLTQTLCRSLSIHPTAMPTINQEGKFPLVDQIINSIKNSKGFRSTDLKIIISLLISEGFITAEDHVMNRIKVAIVLINLQAIIKEEQLKEYHAMKQQRQQQRQHQQQLKDISNRQIEGGWAS